MLEGMRKWKQGTGEEMPGARFSDALVGGEMSGARLEEFENECGVVCLRGP